MGKRQEERGKSQVARGKRQVAIRKIMYNDFQKYTKVFLLIIRCKLKTAPIGVRNQLLFVACSRWSIVNSSK